MTNNKGFTLIELVMVIILLGILSASAVVLIGNITTQQRFDETVKEMGELKKAMVGNTELIESGVRSSFGYAGDMGPLPPTTGTCPSCGLLELVNGASLPAWSYDSATGTGIGWHGPYVDAKQDDSSRFLALLDGWGNYYYYNSATGQITSYGPDGTSGGGDDITIPGSSLAGEITGNITGRITSASGNALSGITVTVTHPNPASRGNSTTSTGATNADGFYTITGIPIGKHKVSATIDSTTYDRSATFLPGQAATMDFSPADTTVPNAPVGLSATPVTTTSISLSWTASSSADVVSYNIYRSQASGGETLFAAGVKGTTYVDSACSTGGQYYYTVAAVDYSGNVSAQSAETNAYASPVQQNAAMAGNGTAAFTVQIKNGTSSNILINSMNLVIVKTSAGNRNLTSIAVNGTTYWTGSQALNGTGTFTISIIFNAGGGTYTLIPAGTPNVVLNFNNTVTESSMTFQFNTQDGYFYVY